MPTLAQGASVTLPLSGNSLVNVRCASGMYSIEWHTGTPMADFSGADRFFGPMTAGSFKINALERDLVYDVVVLPSAAAAAMADWAANSGPTQILNKPTLFSGSWSDLTNLPAAASQASASRTLNSAFQVSATRNSLVAYTVQIQVTASISGGQNGDVVLEIAPTSNMTGAQTVSIAGLGQTYTLAVALQGVQPQSGMVFGFVPAGYYARLRTVNNTGTPAFTYRSGQEVLL